MRAKSCEKPVVVPLFVSERGGSPVTRLGSLAVLFVFVSKCPSLLRFRNARGSFV